MSLGDNAAAHEPFKVFRDNWATFALWSELWPRWRVVAVPGGVIRQALDLAQLHAAMTLAGIHRADRTRIYRDLLAMEDEALEAMNE